MYKSLQWRKVQGQHRVEGLIVARAHMPKVYFKVRRPARQQAVTEYKAGLHALSDYGRSDKSGEAASRRSVPQAVGLVRTRRRNYKAGRVIDQDAAESKQKGTTTTG